MLLFVSAFAGNYTLVLSESIPEGAAKVLTQRIGQMLEAGGHSIADEGGAVLEVSPLTASWMEPTPGQKALTLELQLSAGEVTEIFILKGVGADEADAWERAVKQLLPRSKAAQNFVSRLTE